MNREELLMQAMAEVVGEAPPIPPAPIIKVKSPEVDISPLAAVVARFLDRIDVQNASELAAMRSILASHAELIANLIEALSKPKTFRIETINGDKRIVQES